MASKRFKEVWKEDARLRVSIIAVAVIAVIAIIASLQPAEYPALNIVQLEAQKELVKDPIIKREMERKDAEEKALAEKGLIQERAAHAGILQNKFYDDGLDIKVSVWGHANQNLSLKFVLFNDVWVHKFKTGSLFTEIVNKGFKYVVLTDGYDQSWYWNL